MDSLSQFSALPNEVLIEIFRKVHHKSIFKLVLEDMKSESFFFFLIKVDEIWLSLTQEHFPYISEHFSLSYEMIKGKYPWREFTDTPFDRFLCLSYFSQFNKAIFKGGFLKSGSRYLKINNEAQIEILESIHPSLFLNQENVILRAKWYYKVDDDQGKFKILKISLGGKITSKRGNIELSIKTEISQILDRISFSLSFNIYSKILGAKFPLFAELKMEGDGTEKYQFEYPGAIISPERFNRNSELFFRTLMKMDSTGSIDVLSENILEEFKKSKEFYAEIMETLFIN